MTKIFDAEGIELGKYRKSYPELLTFEEFEPLKDDELAVCWWYACPSSPILNMEDGQRMFQAAAEVWKSNEIAWAYSEEFMENRLPNQEQMLEAIERMKTINPTVREKAYGMVNKMFEQFEQLLDRDITQYKKADGTIDSNSYVAVRQRIQAQLPKLIEQMEAGFGTHKFKEMKERAGQQNIDEFLKKKETRKTDPSKLD